MVGGRREAVKGASVDARFSSRSLQDILVCVHLLLPRKRTFMKIIECEIGMSQTPAGVGGGGITLLYKWMLFTAEFGSDLPRVFINV